jgi:hypothetical protein
MRGGNLMQVDKTPAADCSIRVVSIYATRWRHRGPATEDLQLNLRLGRLEDFYAFYKDQLPRPLLAEQIAVEDVAFRGGIEGATLISADTTLFALPSNQVVVAVALRFTTSRPAVDPAPTARVLERCIHAQLLINGRRLPEYVRGLAESKNAFPITEEKAALLPERHQLVFVPRLSEEEEPPSPEVINEIVYREDPPYREEFTEIQQPGQLNLDQPQRTLGVVTPYVSLIYGHEGFVEDSIFLSTVHAVGTASRFRQIWHEAYRHVRTFRDEKQKQSAGEQTRAELEELADHLGNLEFDLTFSVEFPLMRIESFHSALYGAMDLPNQAQTLSQMFTQLGGSLKSEITAIDIRERRRDDSRQKWNAVAASILSLIGVPIGFVLAFFGINATQVNQQQSMLDIHYEKLYIAAGVFAFIPVVFILFPYVRDWFRRRAGWRAFWLGLSFLTAGILATTAAAAQYRNVGATFDIVDAGLAAAGAIAVLAGFTTAVAGLVGGLLSRRDRRRAALSTLVADRYPAPGERVGRRGGRPTHPGLRW